MTEPFCEKASPKIKIMCWTYKGKQSKSGHELHIPDDCDEVEIVVSGLRGKLQNE